MTKLRKRGYLQGRWLHKSGMTGRVPVYWPAERPSPHDSATPGTDPQYPVWEFPTAHCPNVGATHNYYIQL